MSLMKPSEIIFNATHFLPTNLRSMTKYAYHFTDVNNAANILNSGKIFSRNKATRQQVMVNDNAAINVIEGTSWDVHDNVRFYFRPKTPTQYRNEGIRSYNEIDPFYRAHCPVPVFFLFDIDGLLCNKNAKFTHESLASHYNVQRHSFLENSNNLTSAPFHHIYHFNQIQNWENTQEIVKRRHAEIIIPDECDLLHLKTIFCRSQHEGRTLLSLVNPSKWKIYQRLIKIPIDTSIYFFNSYLRVESVTFDNNRDLHIKWVGYKPTSYFKFRFDILTRDTNISIAYAENDNFQPQVNSNTYWLSGQFLKNHNDCWVEIRLNDKLIYKSPFRFVK